MSDDIDKIVAEMDARISDCMSPKYGTFGLDPEAARNWRDRLAALQAQQAEPVGDLIVSEDDIEFVQRRDCESGPVYTAPPDLEQRVAELEAENKVLAKKATLRGARIQIMWEWMCVAVPSTQYDRVRDQFLWHNKGASSWFDRDGVPTEGEGE